MKKLSKKNLAIYIIASGIFVGLLTIPFPVDRYMTSWWDWFAAGYMSACVLAIILIFLVIPLIKSLFK